MKPQIELNDGSSLLKLGFGTYCLKSTVCEQAVRVALKAGYRSIDTATIYRNEEAVGKAILESGIPREEIHLTTKISPRESGFESTLNAINCSLVRLGVDYIDVCLIHWPGTAKFKPDDIEQVERRIQTWLALEHARKQRIVRTIGVSNFLPRHIDSIISDPRTSIVPAINQIELHPLLLQKETTAYCSQKSIAVQSYSTLGQGNASLLEHPTISAIVNAMRERMGCERVRVTSCHVCLRWAMQHGYAVIPRSSNPDRIEDNARALLLCDLNEIEMAAIDSISVHDGEKKFCWDPSPIC